MELERFKKIGKCCACKAYLKYSESLNMAALNYHASWQYPTMGNILTGASGQAVAYLCDQCYDSGNPDIKFAVEFSGNKIIYHSLAQLNKIKV
jgi:hypothetical protein